MKNLKNDALKTVWRTVLALMLVAGFGALTISLSQGVALAEGGHGHGDSHDVTFTKWITTFPNMAGVVGGDVGVGTFAGEILSVDNSTSGITKIHALYHFNGRRHSFTADNHVTQDNVAGMAVITGRVTEGWLEGARVTGGYKVWAACPIVTGNSPCFQGTLHLRRGDRD